MLLIYYRYTVFLKLIFLRLKFLLILCNIGIINITRVKAPIILSILKEGLANEIETLFFTGSYVFFC